MELVLFDKKATEYGFAERINFVPKEEFNGNVKCMCIGYKESESKWYKVFGFTDEQAEKIIESGTFIIEDKILDTRDGKPLPLIGYYIPYYVKNHKSFEPGIKFMPHIKKGKSYEVVIEVMFSSDEKTRYVYATSKFVADDDKFDLDDFIPHTTNYIYPKEGAYAIDMYDIIGEKYELRLTCPQDIFDYTIAKRLIDIKEL